MQGGSASGFLMVNGEWMSDTGCEMRDAGCKIRDAGYEMIAIDPVPSIPYLSTVTEKVTDWTP